MKTNRKIKYLYRIRVVCLPLCVVLLIGFVVAAVGQLYAIRPRPARGSDGLNVNLQAEPRPPLADYLAAVRSREMFKQSLLYETKKTEVVNVLGDLSFMGVVREGETLRAFILNKKSGQSGFYSAGQSLEDLEIKEIHDDRIILNHGDETLELKR